MLWAPIPSGPEAALEYIQFTMGIFLIIIMMVVTILFVFIGSAIGESVEMGEKIMDLLERTIRGKVKED